MLESQPRDPAAGVASPSPGTGDLRFMVLAGLNPDTLLNLQSVHLRALESQGSEIHEELPQAQDGLHTATLQLRKGDKSSLPGLL